MQKNKQVTVFINNNGYGAFVIKTLSDAGYQIKIATNVLEEAIKLKVIGYLGQIEILKIKIDCEGDIIKALENSFLAINCIEALSLNKKSLIKAYQTLPSLIAKSQINFIHFSTIISLNSHKFKLAKIQNQGNINIIDTLPTALILRLPTFIIGDSQAFDNIGNIAKNINLLITSKFDLEQKIMLLKASDIKTVILNYLTNKISGTFDLLTEGIEIEEFYKIIAKSCQIKQNNIIKLPNFLFSIFCMLIRYQPIIDALSLEKTKLSLIMETPINPLFFAKNSENIIPLIEKQFVQFNTKSEISQNTLFRDKEYYPKA